MKPSSYYPRKEELSYKIKRNESIIKKLKDYNNKMKVELYDIELEWATDSGSDLSVFHIFHSNPNDSKTNRKTYIIKDKSNGLYKIGRSIDPVKREKTLQSEKPNLELIKTWDADIEKTLHDEYKDFRVRGEWFELSKVQVKYICCSY